MAAYGSGLCMTFFFLHKWLCCFENIWDSEYEELPFNFFIAFGIVAGYGKMPEYEHIFTDFLLSLGQGKYKKKSG